jgi:hypothetical protein
MNRLTLNLPDGLLETVMELSGASGKTETIIDALRAYEADLRLKRLQGLRGQVRLSEPSSLREEAP